MIFATLSGSSFLREVSSIMLAFEGKINHLGLTGFPKRSTLSDANKKRSSSVFADICHAICGQYKKILSDSNPRTLPIKDLKIVDSSTISLFSDVLKGAYFVTRQNDNAVYQSLEEFDITEEIHPGVLKDEYIEVIKDKRVVKLRRIAFIIKGKNNGSNKISHWNIFLVIIRMR